MRRYLQMLSVIGGVLAPFTAGTLTAAEDQHPTVKITLHPAAPPSPVLKYRLLPPIEDQRPGNAVVWYLKVPHERTVLFADQAFWETMWKWQEMPLTELREEGKKYAWIASPGDGTGVFEELDYGSRCEWCDWQIPIHDHEFYSIQLPDIQSARALARLLAAQARLQIANGKYENAVRTFRMGYALARHVSQGPTLIQGLVGCTIVGMTSYQVETFIQQPDAPNLYWALASLPRPMIDLRQAFEAEMAAMYLSYPELRNLDTTSRSPAEWQHLLEQVVDSMYASISENKSGDWPAPNLGKDRQQWLAAAVRDGYPRARQALVGWGRSPDEVDAMPAAQVILLYTMRTYNELRDEVLAALLMPYPQARQAMERAVTKLHKSHDTGREIIPLNDVLLPVVRVSNRAGGRIDRDIAMLEILEALRMYAAAHDGRLPESLKDITEVPIPIDPMRAEPFLYERKGDTAVLDAPSRDDTYTKRYQIELVRGEAKP